MNNLSLLNTPRINGKRYEHYIHTGDDSTFLVACASRDTRLFSVTNDARVLDHTSHEIGTFHLDNNHLWYFESTTGDFKFESGNKNLIKAEVKLFKKLLGDDTPDWRYNDVAGD